MIKNKPKLHHNPSTALLIGTCILLMWLMACKSLQQQKGYENYSKNTNWKTNKL